jgi:hypothetical protein
VEPEIQGAVVGAAATAIGGAIAWAGARSQAKASLEAVRMQVRAQLFDSRQQVRREGYAAFFSSVEQLRSALGHAHSVWTEESRDGAALGPGSRADDARRAAFEEMKALWFQQSLIRLSVTGLERITADSLVSQANGVLRDFVAWASALERGDPSLDLDRRYLMRSGELAGTVEHVMETAKGWLDGNPELDPPRRALWRRIWDWWHSRRHGDLDDA